MRWGTRIVLALLATCFALTAFAQQSEDLESLTRAEAEAREEKARLENERKVIISEINALKAELSRTTQETTAFEREGTRLAETIATIDVRLTDLTDRLDANREKTIDLLAALQRLQMSPSGAAIADTEDAVAMAQAGAMIDALSSELSDRAKAIARTAEELAATRAEAEERRIELDANSRELRRRRERTQALVAEKERLRTRISQEEEAAAAEVARLAAESATLRELLDRLADPVPDAGPSLKPDRPDVMAEIALPEGTKPFSSAKGAVIRPVSGRLSRGFGRGENGQTYAAPSEGQVVAPYSGRVEFAGPFKGHGRVVILNMDDGYFFLMTGLDQTFVSTNETVIRGEPIGIMPNRTEAQLYLELRHNGRTIDPAPWLG